MAEPLLSSCCRCYSLRAGSLISGIMGILLSIISIIVIFTTRVEFKTILMDWLPQNVVKIIFALNLCMTILISLLMIFGVLKCNLLLFAEKSLPNDALGYSWNHAGDWIVNQCHIYRGGLFYRWICSRWHVMDYYWSLVSW
uniref:(northern house mosquito) hypothetical protein n=1 Tax=Culex pipiens TaxID=7175 RepID=A0A8D8K5Q0_CULPI